MRDRLPMLSSISLSPAVANGPKNGSLEKKPFNDLSMLLELSASFSTLPPLSPLRIPPRILGDVPCGIQKGDSLGI